MNIIKLLDKLKNYLDADRREQIAEYDSVKRILKKLKKKEKALKQQLKAEQNEEVINQLQREIDVIFAQREKGINLQKSLKEAKKSR
ncbi:hypothetical protein AAD001_03925 [Colwelliaceae bacterium 6471]